jgi:hypothetical protein
MAKMQNAFGLYNVPLTKKLTTINGNIYRRLTDIEIAS